MEAELEDATRLWVVALRDVGRVAAAVAGGEAGRGFTAPRRNQTDQHRHRTEQAVRGIKQPFLDWIVAMGQRSKDNVTWWGSRLAWKSPLATDFFLLVTYTQLVQAWLDGARRGLVRIAIVEDPWLRWLLKRNFARDVRVKFCCHDLRECILDAAYWLGRAPLAVGYALLSFLWTALLARLLGPRRSGTATGARARSVLIYTWLDERCVSVPGEFYDPYTGWLE